jgi:hypothetical protein
MAEKRHAVIHFTDGTKITLKFPKQAGTDPLAIIKTVKRAIEADRILAEVDGELLIIPLGNVKYIHVSPAPEHLPQEVLRNVQLAG